MIFTPPPCRSRSQHLKRFFALRVGVSSQTLASHWLTSSIRSIVSALSRKRMAAPISESSGPRVRFRPEADICSIQDAPGDAPTPSATMNSSALHCLHASPGNSDFALANFIGLGPALAPPSRSQRQAKC